MNLPPLFWTYLKVVLLVATVPAIVGFVIVLAERRIMGFMQAKGLHPTGMPFSTYPRMEPDSDGNWEVIAGLPVAEPVVE